MKYKNIFLTLATAAALITGCRQWDDFTTYFNTYYNADRLIKESEEEFEYNEEKKRIKPRVLVPQPKFYIPALQMSGPPEFMKDFIINQQKLQPVKIKLDSVIIKGSKILAKHPKSNYVEKTLYLMAKAFFYRNEWVNSQIKCSELVDKFPDGDYSPDAHLLMAINYLIQRKFLAGEVILSRTVDVAWQKKRYDILSEAFRLEAELALYQDDLDGALKPYKQAIVQCDDDEQRAKWQVDLASLLFRMGKFEEAEKSFAKVFDFSPDYLAEFEAKLYGASCLSRIGEFEKADNMLKDLESDGKWKEWDNNIFAERMNWYRVQMQDSLFTLAETYADSAYIGSDAISIVYYERGADYYSSGNYIEARKYFARAKTLRTPIYSTVNKLYQLLTTWEARRNYVVPLLKKRESGFELGDTVNAKLALSLFELGRVHDQLGNMDSAGYYYKLSVDLAPPADETTARFLYAYARFIEDDEPVLSDSIMDEIVARYPKTDYGRDAIMRLGYTDEFLIDTVAELYFSGSKLRENKEYYYAIQQFLKIFEDYSESDYAPKSLYSVGWIYEKDLKNLDTALYYYLCLIEKYPGSRYSLDIMMSVDYLLALINGEPIPDSLRAKKLIEYKNPAQFEGKRDIEVRQIPKTEDRKTSEEINSMEAISNPSGIIDGLIKNIPNPEDMLKDTFNPLTNTDSLKQQFTPSFEMNNPFKNLKDSTDTDKEHPIPPEGENPHNPENDSTKTKKPPPPK